MSTFEGHSQTLDAHRSGAPVGLALAGLAALLALVVGSGLYVFLSRGRAAAPAPVRADRLVGEGLLRLPPAARGPAAAALGSAEPGFQVHPSVGGFAATSPTQHLSARFTDAGASVRADGGRLGLRLAAEGFGSSLTPVAAARPSAHANRVVYARAGLQEWYANGQLGLEQGFAIAHAPAGDQARPLTLAIALSGNLKGTVEQGGHGVTFTRVGRPVLRYAGLTASDASGRALRSWLSLGAGRLLLHVDAAGASYPLRIDPFVQQGKKLTGGEEELGKAEFGESVAIAADGDTALVGAGRDDGNVGAAWVFTRSGSTWTQQGKKLTGGGEVGKAFFGFSVALSADGNTALVGGVEDNGGTGAAWVFTRSGSTWTQQGKKLTGSEEHPEGAFGLSVALSADGNTALIGGSYYKTAPEGGAWVFTRSGEAWTQQGKKLTGGEEVDESLFGSSVALSYDGDTALIGGFDDDEGVGAAWVFTRTGTTWAQQGKKLTGTGETAGEGDFGFALALSGDGDTALIGGEGDSGHVGAAWAFTRSGEAWTQQGPKLTGGEEVGEGYFGSSLALSEDGDTALISGSLDNGQAGAAWEFTRSGETWTQDGSKLTGGEEVGEGYFGTGVALSAEGDIALIGGGADNSQAGAVWAFASNPAVSTGIATEPTPTTALLNATVDPGGEEVSECKFEYGTTTAYGSSASCSPAPGSGESPVAVTAALKGLSANTTYHFRVVARNVHGTNAGADQDVTTLQTSSSGESTEPSKPASAKDGELSIEASGGTGAVTIGPYGSDVGVPGLFKSAGKYFDAYRSTNATFPKIEFTDCELAGGRAIYWFDPATGWEPIPAPTAIYTEAPTPCITVTITETSKPDVQQMTGMRYGTGEDPGPQEYGKCEAATHGLYTERACMTVAEKGGKPDHKGKFNWYPAPVGCFAKKNGRYAESACLKLDLKKGKPKGKYEAAKNNLTGSGGAVKLESGKTHELECTASSSEGVQSAVQTGSVTLTLTGCKHEGTACSSAQQPPETIRSGALQTLTYEEGKKYFTGLIGSPLLKFTCGSGSYTLGGEVSSETSGDIDVMSATSALSFTAGSGEQDLTLEGPMGKAAVTLIASQTVTSVEAVELDTKVAG